ncbi:succinylglutamate desuccinylase/aspartoacylase family protein [Arthrobacter crystallopoietes BAB-32]|uniref:Succinylglutamate desuccinylase/aspartoacylase family protein n=1 Tax=Arthrobacter crystallopoietes BAB-32 TaxID=1246476 RepID=N1V6Y2_9MICC|nr:succinylglutamate desuccinylase/aspartoacylase family protein [Arthrobacter crystallopoietes]EMY34013.1 succinylglutamate desuccinylase/aspartoacylase family protein [Arthrobacter crystallopoietes BAB-32]
MGSLTTDSGVGTGQRAGGVVLHGVELGRPGKQLGFAALVHSDNVYDNSLIPVPVAVVSSGQGPTALLVAGTHGDEYEGQVVLHELIRSLEPEHIEGTVIIVPAANAPAVRAGTRVSPIDGGNLNRSYPGEVRGGPTNQVADFIAGTLLPEADVVVDLHSGGSNSTYVPCTFLYRGPDDLAWERKTAAARAMGLPYAMVVRPRLEPGSLSTAGDDAGTLALATELGGGGTVDPDVLGSARRGVRSLLEHVGIMSPQPAPEPAEPVWLELVPESPVVAGSAGVFEPLVALGQRVRAGQPVVRIHAVDELDRAPHEFTARMDGVVAILRRPALVTLGSYLLHVAPEIEAPRP